MYLRNITLSARRNTFKETTDEHRVNPSVLMPELFTPA